MKRMITTLCVLAIALTGVAPAMAAETRSSHYYPVEVREYMEGDSPRIDKGLSALAGRRSRPDPHRGL